MTDKVPTLTEKARQAAEEISTGIFGAGASETQRLGSLAVSTINALANELDKVKPTTKAVEPVHEPEKSKKK